MASSTPSQSTTTTKKMVSFDLSTIEEGIRWNEIQTIFQIKLNNYIITKHSNLSPKHLLSFFSEEMDEKKSAGGERDDKIYLLFKNDKNNVYEYSFCDDNGKYYEEQKIPIIDDIFIIKDVPIHLPSEIINA